MNETFELLVTLKSEFQAIAVRDELKRYHIRIIDVRERDVIEDATGNVVATYTALICEAHPLWARFYRGLQGMSEIPNYSPEKGRKVYAIVVR